MNKYTFQITIETLSREEAVEKIKAAVIVMQKLNNKELHKLSEYVQDPAKMALAKTYFGLK
jgi:hypothetical protein